MKRFLILGLCFMGVNVFAVERVTQGKAAAPNLAPIAVATAALASNLYVYESSADAVTGLLRVATGTLKTNFEGFSTTAGVKNAALAVDTTTLGLAISTAVIRNSSTLQSGATFFVSSGTAQNFNASTVAASEYYVGKGTVSGAAAFSSGTFLTGSNLGPGTTVFSIMGSTFVVDRNGYVRISGGPTSSILTVLSSGSPMIANDATYEYNGITQFMALTGMANQTLQGNLNGVKSTVFVPRQSNDGSGGGIASMIMSGLASSATWTRVSGNITMPDWRGVSTSVLVDGPGGAIDMSGINTSFRVSGPGNHNSIEGFKSVISADSVAGHWFAAYGCYIDIFAGAAYNDNTSFNGNDDSYGFYINRVSGNKNNWGVYVSPAVKNYFAGSVGVGTNTPTNGYAFDVKDSSIIISGNGPALVIGSTGAVQTIITPSSHTWPTPFTNAPEPMLGPGYDLLSSTFPDQAISSMTVSFSTRTTLYIVITASNNTSNAGGDIMVLFNGDLASNYTLSRTTTAAAAIVGTATAPASGLPIFGDGVSTNSVRTVELCVTGRGNWNKTGTFLAGSLTSRSAISIQSRGSLGWENSATGINQVTVFLAGQGVASARDSTLRQGSYIRVYGQGKQ